METQRRIYDIELSTLSIGRIYLDWIYLPFISESEESSWSRIKAKYRE
ncbi:MAG: hypothetical protein GF417_00480 [Candidatus Latescibacteria bacterium]|nr:hypothetical protein [bacterium]MBD3422903.1 hypothetical protein [Candidatus Latescibacterota bacterium]